MSTWNAETTTSSETLEERLDRMWAEHIMACLAIINAWEEREYERAQGEVPMQSGDTV